MPTPNPNADWTSGPAKWAAVVILGGASLAGMAWSIFGREPRVLVVPYHTTAPPVSVTDRDERPAPDAPTEGGGPGASLAAPEPAPAPPFTAVDSGPKPLETRLINLNSATAAELELLPGIGPALAARIVEHRAASGPFKSVNELDHVRGIGPRTMDALRPLVTVK